MTIKENELRIRSLYIDSIGPIENIEIKFSDGINIISGINGLGKSTILACILQIARVEIGRWEMFEERTSLREIPPLLPTVTGGRESGKFSVAFGFRGEFYTQRTKLVANSNFSDPEKQISHQECTPSYDPVQLQGLMLHFGLNRSIRYSNVKKRAHRIRYIFSALRLPTYRSDGLKEWSIKKLNGYGQIGLFDSYESDNASTLIEVFSMIESEYRFDAVDKDEIIIQTPLGKTIFENLSSGYQSCFTVLAGIIRLMDDNHISSQKFNGVLLIDEIDLHLHPKWQSRLIKMLSSIAPNAQIISTTHSPHVLQSLGSEQIIPLKRNPQGGVELVELLIAA